MLTSLDLPQRLSRSTARCPVLLMHGRADGIVPFAQARELAQAMDGRARLIALEGRHHLDPVFDDAAIAQIEAFARSLASAPER